MSTAQRPGPPSRPDKQAEPTVSAPAAELDPLANADFPWDQFDSDAYLRHNYGTLHDADRALIARLAEFFSSIAPPRAKWHGIDVGSGTNLYPTLAMLPLTETITLWEHSLSNIRWLEHGLRPYGQVWEPFWQALTESAELYRRFPRPQAWLPARAKLEKASIFDLPEAQWDIGTMFFVAESITGVRAEFELATGKFIRSLRPGSPFAAAFMRQSRGYTVGNQRFPAVAVTEEDIAVLLGPLADQMDIHLVASAERLREGYDGMILATGRRAAASQPRRGRR